ncbi:MAG: tetratricopeptide repeat protein [Bacteroidales bacterium]
MKIMNRTIKAIFTVLIFALCSGNSFSQKTMNDVIASYNSAIQAQQSGNLEAALDSFKSCVAIATELGEEADDLRIQAEGQIPVINYEIGRKYASEKNYDMAIKQFTETLDIAKVYGTEDDVNKVTNALGQVYYIQATTFYKEEKFSETLEMLNKSLEYLPGNSKALYIMALTYKGMDNEEKVAEAARNAADAAKAGNDNKLYEGSLKIGRDYYLLKADGAKNAKKYDTAIKYLQTSLEFDGSNASTYYLMTQIYNTQKMWDNAISAANKALEFEKPEPVDQAKIYYEIGNAYKEKGENDKACEAFKKAAVGAFKESSDYMIQHVLKCE